MDRYFFDVVGDFAANDFGHEFAHDSEARDHARYITSRLASEKPELVESGNLNYVRVRDEGTSEIFRIPIAPDLQPVT